MILMLVRLKLFSSFLKNRVTGYKIPGGQLFFIQHHENITVLFLVFIIADEKSAISLFFSLWRSSAFLQPCCFKICLKYSMILLGKHHHQCFWSILQHPQYLVLESGWLAVAQVQFLLDGLLTYYQPIVTMVTTMEFAPSVEWWLQMAIGYLHSSLCKPLGLLMAPVWGWCCND